MRKLTVYRNKEVSKGASWWNDRGNIIRAWPSKFRTGKKISIRLQREPSKIVNLPGSVKVIADLWTSEHIPVLSTFFSIAVPTTVDKDLHNNNNVASDGLPDDARKRKFKGFLQQSNNGLQREYWALTRQNGGKKSTRSLPVCLAIYF